MADPALPALLLVLVPGALILLLVDVSVRLLLWELALVGIAWIALALRGLAWSDVGLRAPEGGWAAAAGLGALGAVVLLTGSLLLRLMLQRALGWTTDTGAFRRLEGDPRALAAGVGAAWLVGALGEEMLYRGFLLDTVHALLPGALGSGGFGWWLALGASSIFFGAAHGFQGRAAAVVAGAIGMGYGAVYFAAGFNLWPAILAHGLYDTVAFVLVYKGIRIGAREGEPSPVTRR